MSDKPLHGQLVDSALVAGIAARAARETPGVVRLATARSHVFSRLRLGAASSWRTTAGRAVRHSGNPDAPTLRDGVVARIHDGAATIEVDLATDAAFNAREVATTVRDRIAQALVATGVGVGSVDVTVSAIEPAPGT